MSRKDYELIARVLDDLDGFEIGLSIGTHRAIAEALAEALAEDNPQFKRDKFLAASGVTL